MSWYPKGTQPSYKAKRQKTSEQRFWEKVDKTGPCWNWTATKNNWGYGQFYEESAHILAHKWAYKTFIGPIPKGSVIRHSCDNPSCVNPQHLSLGTRQDNVDDAVKRGRLAKGDKRLNEEKKKMLIKMLKLSVPQTQIADILGVCVKTVRDYERLTCSSEPETAKDE